MRRAVMAVCLALVCPHTADALSIRAPVPVAVRARLDVHVLATEAAGEWTVTSRSPADPSRLMADLTAGNDATGVLYLKGVSEWSDAGDPLGRVEFRAEQGDYARVFAWSDSATARLRLFGDERRFFTHELGTALVEDDEADDFEHRLGARADARMQAVRVTYWIAALDTGDERRANQYGALRFAPAPAFLSVSYLHDAPDAGSNHAVAKAEAAAYFRSATALASLEASGDGDGGAFPSLEWDDFDPGYAAAAPENAATYAELRTRRTRIGEDHRLDVSYAYSAVGSDYRNDLSSLVPGSVTHRAWIDWAHRRYAVDARLTARHIEQSAAERSTRSGLDVTARARMTDHSEWLLRGGTLREEIDAYDTTSGFAHVAYTRELREFSSAVHVLVDDIGEEAAAAAGAEIRLNLSATSAVSGRWIIVDEAGGGDALWARVEFRPTRRAWVTVAYGRETRGDDAYFLEDRDHPPAPGTGNVITISVRGDL